MDVGCGGLSKDSYCRQYPEKIVLVGALGFRNHISCISLKGDHRYSRMIEPYDSNIVPLPKRCRPSPSLLLIITHTLIDRQGARAMRFGPRGISALADTRFDPLLFL